VASLTQIANRALNLVGQVDIAALTDPGDAAAKANRFILPAIREVLQLGVWSAARKRAQLAQLTAAPAFEFGYAYQLPNDYLRMVAYNELDAYQTIPGVFAIEGKQLLSNDTPIYLIYVADLTQAGNDTNLLDERLTELFVINLASKLAWPFQQSVTLKEALLKEFQMKLQKALSADARENGRSLRSKTYGSQWVPERRFSTNA
jgi:hypothetical protein